MAHDGDTRSAILDAAQRLVQRHGINGISFQHVADAVGLRKASLHHHFATKDDLVRALLERYSREFLARVDGLLAGAGSAPERLRRYVGLFEATLRDEGGPVCLCGMLGAELAALRAPAVRAVGAFYRANAERLATLLEQGRREGSLAFAGDALQAGWLVVSLLEGAMLTVRAEGGPPRFRAMTRQLLDLLGAR